MQLKDVAVLITGGGSGLGAATARAMAAKGAKIAMLDQSKENAEKVAAEVKGVALHADVTDEEAIKAAIAKAEAAHGIARVLMNCAGIGGSQRIVGKDGVYPLAKFVAHHQRQSDRHLQLPAAVRRAPRHGGADRRRARRHHQHRERRGL